MESYKIKVEDGRVPITINNERDEELGVVYINPNDFNMIKRLEDAKNNISALIVTDKDISGEDAGKKIAEIDEKIKEQVDYLFDYKVSDIVFKSQHSLSLHNGDTFIERLLNALTPVITDIVNKETEKSEKRMSKYTKAYTQDHKTKKK